MAIVYLSLGSNSGDRVGYVQQATSLLGGAEGVDIIRTSSFYETEPWNMNTETWFVNAVVEIKTSLSPQDLLAECKRIEQQLGRKPDASGIYEDRTIDIDILFYNKDIVNDETVTIPHKFVHLRAFTLVPLLELIPDYVHPVLGKSIIDLHGDLENPEMVFLYGTRVEGV
jgi:2-amino-4-hydroxy-6-hydroxymethyldihydropteridine diphosphokinase